MFTVFENPKYLDRSDVIKTYPDSKFIMRDVKDVENLKGYLVTVSTDVESFDDLCNLYQELNENGEDVIIMGSYRGANVGILH